MTWLRRLLPRLAARPARTDDDLLGALVVTRTVFLRPDSADESQGVIAWAELELYAAIRVLLEIRRMPDGRHVVVFPKGRLANGDAIELVSPINDLGYTSIEKFVLDQFAAAEARP